MIAKEASPPRAVRAMDAMTPHERDEYRATLALRHTTGLGARGCARLLRFFGSAREAQGNMASWGEAGVHNARPMPLAPHSLPADARAEEDAALRHGDAIVLWQDDAYPERLRELPDAPALLYCRGDISLLHAPSIAVVGSRDCTAEGVRVAVNIARALSESGVSVVSGMALGIDRAAHKAALQGVGKSIAVLGTGLDVVYPGSNRDIFEALTAQGLALTEFAYGTPPLAGHFPIRNRIISGLSLGVLVVEATLRSGSLITARLANEQNREVYAIPGPASVSASLGCQELIRQGARPVFNADDILHDIAPQLAHLAVDVRRGIQYSSAQCTTVEQPRMQCTPENENALRIMEALRTMEACPVDAICVATGLAAASVNIALTELEVLARVQRLPGGRYCLRASA